MVLLPQPPFSPITAVIIAPPRSAMVSFSGKSKMQHYNVPAELRSLLRQIQHLV